MNRMVYFLFALTILVVSGAVVSVTLPKTNDREKNNFAGLSLSQNHMNFAHCYSFFLREEDGKAIFDAQIRFFEEPYEIILESCEVDNYYMKKLRKIQQKYSIVQYVEGFKEKKALFKVLDRTSNTTTIYYEDAESKTADTASEYKDELYKFFVELAEKYSRNSVAA